MRILLLCQYDPFNASMVTDHIDAFSKYSIHKIFLHRSLVSNQGNLEDDLDLDWFDVIIVHYSIFVGVDAYLSVKSKYRLSKSRAVKVVFLQDEYRFVQRSIDGLLDIKASIVFTCVPESSIPAVYGTPELKDIQFINTLTGYIPDILTHLQPLELNKRKYHVSYRGRKYPDWHGSMGREKFEIAEKFTKAARGSGLKMNISTRERDRVYGHDWIDLIQNSRAVLGVESGASVFDFSGEVSAKTETRRMILGRKGITYEELREQYFADIENTIDLAQISPRVFEAMSLRTLCVLFEGSYSGLLQPDVHYLQIKKDFSNFDEVIKRLKDPIYVSEIIANAYYDIALNPELSYKSFIRRFDQIIKACAIDIGISDDQSLDRRDINHDKLSKKDKRRNKRERDKEKKRKRKNIIILSRYVSPTRSDSRLKSIAKRYLPKKIQETVKRLVR